MNVGSVEYCTSMDLIPFQQFPILLRILDLLPGNGDLPFLLCFGLHRSWCLLNRWLERSNGLCLCLMASRAGKEFCACLTNLRLLCDNACIPRVILDGYF